MRSESNDPSALFDVVSLCGRRTDEISRCALTAISAMLNSHPAPVDLLPIYSASSEGELASKVVQMLETQRLLTGNQNQMHLTLQGYKAVKAATIEDPRLGIFLRINPTASSYDHSSILLSILRAHLRKPRTGGRRGE